MVGTLPGIYHIMHDNCTMLLDSLRGLPSASQVNHINSSLHVCVACLDKLPPSNKACQDRLMFVMKIGYVNIGIVFFFIRNSQWFLYNLLSQFWLAVQPRSLLLLLGSTLSQGSQEEYCKLIGLCLKLMRRQLWPLTCPIRYNIVLFQVLFPALTWFW